MPPPDLRPSAEDQGVTLCYLCDEPLEAGRARSAPVCPRCAVVHLGLASAPAASNRSEPAAPPVAAGQMPLLPEVAAPRPAIALPRTMRIFLDARAPLLEGLHQAIGAALGAGFAPCHLFLATPTFERAAGTSIALGGVLVELHAAGWAALDELLIAEAATVEQIDCLADACPSPAAPSAG
jgi:hypothetical protein